MLSRFGFLHSHFYNEIACVSVLRINVAHE